MKKIFSTLKEISKVILKAIVCLDAIVLFYLTVILPIITIFI